MLVFIQFRNAYFPKRISPRLEIHRYPWRIPLFKRLQLVRKWRIALSPPALSSRINRDQVDPNESTGSHSADPPSCLLLNFEARWSFRGRVANNEPWRVRYRSSSTYKLAFFRGGSDWTSGIFRIYLSTSISKGRAVTGSEGRNKSG